MKIAEVAKQFNVTTDTLRYYEKIGILGPVPKNSSGIRVYTEHDVKRVNFIKCMRAAGLSIEAIKQYIALYAGGNETIPERKQVLLNQRSILEEKINDLQSTLSYLNKKINNYDTTLGNKDTKIS
ncbi:MAG: MerR family transcriptional regulator [Coprobacillaceae bacterium]